MRTARSKRRTVASTPARRQPLFLLVWAALVVCAAILAILPWLWWRGGTLELDIRPFRIHHGKGHAYRVRMWPTIKKDSYWGWIGVEPGEAPSWLFHVPCDSETGPHSTLRLYEDGQPLGPAHSSDEEIAAGGGGRFAHRADLLVLSSSDNTNPRTNGRRYTIRGFSRPRLRPVSGVVVLAVLWASSAGILGIAARHRRRIVAYLERSWAVSRQALVVFSSAAVFTGYVFFFASLRPEIAFGTLVFLVAGSAFLLTIARRRLVLRGWMAWPTAFLLLSAAGAARPAHSFSSWEPVLSLLASAVAGVVVYSVLRRGWAARGGWALGWALCASFAFIVMLQNLGFDLKALIASWDGSEALPWIHSTWNQKYQESWILVLLWTVVAAMAPQGRRTWCLAGLLVAATGAAVGTGYSYTAKLLFLLSVAVFLGAALLPRLTRALVTAVLVGVLLTLPLLVGVAWNHVLERSSSVDWEHGAAKHLIRRLVTWEYARELTSKKPYLGWGLGAAKNLPDGQDTAVKALEEGPGLPEYVGRLVVLPGGHPHSLPFLIWMETGLAGVLLAAGELLTLFYRLSRIRDRSRHGAFVALIATIFATFGFNYPAWEPPLTALLVMTAGLVGAVGLESVTESSSLSTGSTSGET